ncbi:tyrosine-type recombinase/integrase [Metabacillus fastidiosus]|uniref:Tyrosine-type recombinase/integrase n=1 Tax=Metabacillus fastidiosus TaxID=1458 RepID=A0ABU6P5A0_9BACI|nr:tyrosine-type recombinase/integrase [Metabacillus fastidiosus]MED4404103.1 tyrosine-type recombinase/integrase [Metabacillus fastidiosus]
MSLLISINQEIGSFQNMTVPQLINTFLSQEYYEALELRIDQAERDKSNSTFAYFNDYEILYYYCHQRKNIDKDKIISEGTKREYLRELLQFSKNIVQFSEEMGVDISHINEGSLFKSLEPRHIKSYQEWMVNELPLKQGRKAYSPATIARKTTIIKGFLNFLYKNGYIEIDLTNRLAAATVSADERPDRDLGPKEAVELLKFFKEQQHPIIFGILHVLITTGIRNIEFCRARVCDLTYDHVRGEYFLKIHGKGNKKRIVPIKPKVYHSIVEFRKIRGLKTVLDPKDTSPLFVNVEGNAYRNSYLSRYINKVVKRAGFEWIENRPNPITPHVFRHCFAIISYHSGADIYKIMRSLGHEKIETTMIYLQKEFEKEDNALYTWTNGELADFL